MTIATYITQRNRRNGSLWPDFQYEYSSTPWRRGYHSPITPLRHEFRAGNFQRHLCQQSETVCWCGGMEHCEVEWQARHGLGYCLPRKTASGTGPPVPSSCLFFTFAQGRLFHTEKRGSLFGMRSVSTACSRAIILFLSSSSSSSWQVRILENRLDKALTKFNEALAHNKTLRQEVGCPQVFVLLCFRQPKIGGCGGYSPLV